MKTLWIAGISSIVMAAAGCSAPVEVASEETQGLEQQEEHVHLQRGAKPGGGSGSPLMTLHGGAVLVANTTHAIWWGSEWSSPAFAGDKVSGMEGFFAGFGGSGLAAASTEYYGVDNQHVTTASSFTGSSFDATTPPKRALNTSSAVAEACKIANDNPDPNGVYFIFTSTGAGHVNYCAWHSYGTCSNGAPVQVAYMPNIDGIAGCDPQDTWTSHSQGLAALANVTSHELSEAITDPRNGGWYDSSRGENGDKCAWTFTAPVPLSNHTTWKLQQEWSNAAYNAGTGNPNLSGQNGCLQGN